MALRPKVFLASVAACAIAAMTPRMAAAQHITVDGHLSPAQTLIGPNYSIGANLGKQVGSNLFHSFGQFGLSTGESAAFSGLRQSATSSAGVPAAFGRTSTARFNLTSPAPIFT